MLNRMGERGIVHMYEEIRKKKFKSVLRVGYSKGGM